MIIDLSESKFSISNNNKFNNFRITKGAYFTYIYIKFVGLLSLMNYKISENGMSIIKLTMY